MRKLSMDELGRKSVAEFKQSARQPIIAILDNIRSMHNVGSVFRTADAFLIECLCLCGFTPQPPHRDINKTALGATETVDWFYFENTVDVIIELRKKGYTIFAVEQVEGSISLEKFLFKKDDKSTETNIAVIFGNEVEGVSNDVLNFCDGCIEIPQLGMKHSLNISVAAGIVLWELVRQRINYSK